MIQQTNYTIPIIAIIVLVLVVGACIYFKMRENISLEDYDDEALQKMANSWQTILNMLMVHVAMELRLGDLDKISEKDILVDQIAPNLHKATITVEDYIVYIHCDWMSNRIAVTVFKRNDFGRAFEKTKTFALRHGHLNEKKVVTFLNDCYVKSMINSRSIDNLEEFVISTAKVVANEASLEAITEELTYRTIMSPTKLLKNKKSAAAMEMKIYLYAYLLKAHTKLLVDIAQQIQLKEQGQQPPQDPQQ